MRAVGGYHLLVTLDFVILVSAIAALIGNWECPMWIKRLGASEWNATSRGLRFSRILSLRIGKKHGKDIRPFFVIILAASRCCGAVGQGGRFTEGHCNSCTSFCQRSRLPIHV